jgi:hypothetical protein
VPPRLTWASLRAGAGRVKRLPRYLGFGTTALPAARLGANVLGVDIAANLVEAGNARTRDLGVARRRPPAARPTCRPSWRRSSPPRTRARAPT